VRITTSRTSGSFGFYLGTDDIKSLRRRVDDLASAEAAAARGGDDALSKTKPVSTFVALARG
jgi:hypothetical protein